MAMQFNPQTAFLRGMDLGSPTTSQGGINNLMQMKQNTMNDALNAFGNIGKTSRTNTVNDLIARGGLEGLNEAQTQARLLQEAGGTLTPEGQAQVDQLLQRTGKEDQRKFTTSERLGGEQFLGGEHEKTATAKALAEKTLAEQKKLQDDREYTFNVDKFGKEYAEKVRSNKATEGLTARGQNITSQGQVSTNIGEDGYIYKINSAGQPVNTGVKALVKDGSGDSSGSGASGKNKLTGEIRKMWDNSTGKGKLALEEMYKTGDIQAVPETYKYGNDGKKYIASPQKLLFKGKPTTIRELREHLGLK